VVRYDRNLALVWRRTIDQYKHDTRGDAILVTVDGNLLVG
jgi:hypothetical protein